MVLDLHVVEMFFILGKETQKTTMSTNVPPFGVTPPQQPGPAGTNTNWNPGEFKGDVNVSTSVLAWETMFQGMASADDIKKIIQNIIKDTIQKIKEEGDKALEAIKQMKQQQEDDMS